jgi:hypothetical protein
MYINIDLVNLKGTIISYVVIVLRDGSGALLLWVWVVASRSLEWELQG